jgi:hypothetical protein
MHQNSVRQYSKNGLFSYHWGCEIDPYCSKGSATESDSSRSLIMAEAKMALYRLQIWKQLNVPRTVSGLLTMWSNVGDPLFQMW